MDPRSNLAKQPLTGRMLEEGTHNPSYSAIGPFPRQLAKGSRYSLPANALPHRFWGIALFTFSVIFSLVFLGRNVVLQRAFIHQSYSTTRNPAYLIRADHGAVASDNEMCSVIGVEVLKDGGNAVDSAISATFCAGVVTMFSSGIGGGGYITVRLPPSAPDTRSEVYTIDFREVAPALANATMYQNDPYSSIFGGLSVAVPGEVLGLEEAHRRWGVLPWKRLVQPSIELARGWIIGKELGLRIQMFSHLMLHNPDWRQIFAPRGTLLREGELIRRTNYSRTLESIAAEGSRAFYSGPIADSIVRKVRSAGGILTHADLANYQVKVQPALQGTYRNRSVYTTHAPTSGPALLHMLNLMENYDFISEGRTALNVHRFVEAMKFGFSARTRLCDPIFHNSTSRIDQISTKAFANLILRNLTEDRTHPPEYYNPEYSITVDHGTSHISTIDKDGMAVALTGSVNIMFGSQVLDPETGIILNDEMGDFSIPGFSNGFGLLPSPCPKTLSHEYTICADCFSDNTDNYPAPAKRPLSSMTPTIMEYPDGSIFLAVGGSGGSRIFPAIVQVILNLDWGLDVSESIEYGRLHDQLYPLEVDADDVLPSELLDSLKQRGHNVTIYDVNRSMSVIQAVLRKEGTIFAASDSRKNGVAAGY